MMYTDSRTRGHPESYQMNIKEAHSLYNMGAALPENSSGTLRRGYRTIYYALKATHACGHTDFDLSRCCQRLRRRERMPVLLHNNHRLFSMICISSGALAASVT